MENDFSHLSVLMKESIDGLAIKPDGIYMDATFGRGGHSRQILKALSPNGRLIAIDRDLSAIAAAKSLADDPRFSIHHRPFSELETVAEELGLIGKIDGI